MAAMAPDGALEAINLTGLTLPTEMDMALRTGQYRWAATAFCCHWAAVTASMCTARIYKALPGDARQPTKSHPGGVARPAPVARLLAGGPLDSF